MALEDVYNMDHMDLFYGATKQDIKQKKMFMGAKFRTVVSLLLLL